MKKIISLLIILSSCILVQAQDEYSVSAIPDSLKKDAYAVIRYEQTNFVQKDINNATEEVTKVITILDQKGKDMANLYLFQDKFRELKSFSGEIILSSGKVFKKIGKGDLITTAISSDLASDDYQSIYECSSPSYPYTVKYKYEIKWKNGIAWYPVFVPASYHVAVEKSEHRIQFPATESIRYKANELAPNPEKSTLNKDSVYVWKYDKKPAIAWEAYAPEFISLFPVVYIAPNNFCYDGICGKMSNWKELGIFLSQLLDKRDILPPAIIEKVKEITAGTANDKEKVEKIYEYLQNSTRYVSIQLGIGGFQPIPAAQVAKTSYGDCKALTNYMKSMLNVVNIPSDYVIVNTKKKNMFHDFSSLNQSNHVILMVPLKNDTIWLECTSKDEPCNFVHGKIAGHDVLLVKGENSKLCKVRDIPETMNTETNNIFLKISPDASAHASIKSIYKNHNMEEYVGFVMSKAERDKINFLEKNLSVQKSKITNIQTEYNKSAHPEIQISYNMEAERYANQTGNRLFIPINPFRSSLGKSLSSLSRRLDVNIETPEYQTDSITIEIPEHFIIESKPKTTELKTSFGSFSSKIEEKENKLLIIQQINIHTGQYPVSSYSEIKDFFKKIDANLSGQIVLRKE